MHGCDLEGPHTVLSKEGCPAKLTEQTEPHNGWLPSELCTSCSLGVFYGWVEYFPRALRRQEPRWDSTTIPAYCESIRKRRLFILYNK